MLTNIRLVCISICSISLSACMSGGAGNYSNYQPYDYQSAPLYPEGYENTVVYDYPEAPSQKGVTVPASYYVGNTTPVSSKDVDRTWVNNQNPAGYTIEVADGDQAWQVAGSLQKTPKDAHSAEIKYQNNGKAHYKGVYGSYPNYDAANQALNALPEDVRQRASIKTWGSVQQSIHE